MTQKESIKQNIAKLENTLKDPKVPAAFKDKLKSGIAKLEDELKALDKADTDIKKADTPAQTEQAKERKKKTVSKVAKILERAKLMNKKVIKLTEQQISKKVRRAQKLSTSDADIEKDAKIPAKPRSIRVSQGLTGNQYGTKDQNKGRKYYEYRDNRTDRQQPPTNYPKLEEGGMMAEGGKVKPKRSALEKLKGMSKKGKKPVVTRGFSDDEAYEYASGGEINLSSNGRKVFDKMKRSEVNRYMVTNRTVKHWAEDMKIKLSEKEINDVAELYVKTSGIGTKGMHYAEGGMMAKGGDIQSTIRRIDGEDYLFSQAVQNKDGHYTGWKAYKVIYKIIHGEKHIDYKRTKDISTPRYFSNSNVGEEVKGEYFSNGGYMAKGGRPRVIRGFSDDEEYEYGQGGKMGQKKNFAWVEYGVKGHKFGVQWGDSKAKKDVMIIDEDMMELPRDSSTFDNVYLTFLKAMSQGKVTIEPYYIDPNEFGVVYHSDEDEATLMLELKGGALTLYSYDEAENKKRDIISKVANQGDWDRLYDMITDYMKKYKSGGHMLEKSIRQSTIVKPNLSVFN